MANNFHGFANEDILIDYINGQIFENYNENIKNFLIFLYDLVFYEI